MTSAPTRPPLRVLSEPGVYRPDETGFSFYRDLVSLHLGTDTYGKAEERLKRNTLEHGDRSARAERALRQVEERTGIQFERRTNPNRLPGQGGYFAPPAWLEEMSLTAPRPERIVSELITSVPLPDGVSSINIPRFTAGTSAQGGADLAASPEQDVTDANASSSLITIEGMSDWPLQAFEQSASGGGHLDQIIHADLAAAADASLETNLIAGAGSSYGQLVGLLNLSGTTSGTYTSGSPTAGGLYTALSQLLGQTSDARKVRPQVILCRAARWFWLAAQVDTQGRPWVVPNDRFAVGATGGTMPLGTLAGLPAISTEAIPATLGTGGSQDAMIAIVPSDHLLFEGQDRLAALTNPLSGSLGIRFNLRRYVGAVLGRIPAGVGVLGGTGLAVQSGW